MSIDTFLSFLFPEASDASGSAHIALTAIVFTALVLVRYAILATSVFGVGMLVGKLAPFRKIQPLPFTAAQIRREVLHSLRSMLIFAAVIGLVIALSRAGWTQIYLEPGARGWVWFWLQIPAAIMIQDFYFYWMHRAVHDERLYKRVHETHHLSTNPSAFAAFAFHPIEAFLEIAVIILIVMIIPMTPIAIAIYGALGLTYNIYGHMGYEIMPRFIVKSPLGSLLNTAVHHNQHHRTYKYNFGYYTVIWDRLFGTLHPKSESLYDSRTLKPATSAAAPTTGEATLQA